MPATKVSGSPTTGTQANNNDHLPNFLNHFDDLSICVSLNGNHFFLVRFLEYDPKAQLTTDPKIFPRLAAINKNKFSKFDVAINPTNVSSDENGKMVAAKKDITNKYR